MSCRKAHGREYPHSNLCIREVLTFCTRTWVPDGEVGIYHGSVPFTGTGEVVVTISRDGSQLAQVNGRAISSACTDGLFNAWVGSATSPTAVSAQPSLSISEQTCVNGTGANNFDGLCDFSCSYGYCPVTACTCRQMGKPVKAPNSTGVVGYPIAGEDASYSGLCAFNCNLGYCPSSACGTEEVPLVVPTTSDFAPPACVAGTGSGALTGLCSFACNYGFCPMHACKCTAQGGLVPAPATTNTEGTPVEGLEDHGLCNFACSHGYCPEGTCVESGNASSGEVFFSPDIWDSNDPEIQCVPPCTVILPPYPLGSKTTIRFSSMVSSIWTRSGTSTGTKTTILSVPSLVTDGIPFWPVVIGADTTPLGFIPFKVSCQNRQSSFFRAMKLPSPRFHRAALPHYPSSQGLLTLSQCSPRPRVLCQRAQMSLLLPGRVALQLRPVLAAVVPIAANFLVDATRATR